MKTFDEFQLIFVPRKQNILASSFAFAARTCLTPYETKQCTTQIKFRPAVPDNEKYWQIFYGDKQIENFEQSKKEFEPPSLDSDYEKDCLIEENLLDEEVKSPEIAEINMLDNKL